MKRKPDLQYLDHLLSTISISDDPEYLALYIEEGGDLNKPIRGYLAKLIRDFAPRPKGKSRPLRDLSFYQLVEAWRTTKENAPIHKFINENYNTISILDSIRAFGKIKKDRRPKIEEALRHFASEYEFSGDGASEEGTLRKQYQRGRNINSKRI